MSTNKIFSFSPFLLFSFSLFFLLAACSTDMNDAAVNAVETYVQALADKNADQMIAASCAAWEESAQMELDAFVGVETRVENMACAATGTEGVYTLVTCTGEIVATYGAEDRDFPLDTTPFQVKEEGGEMRVCGR
jgi:hypothetical protein